MENSETPPVIGGRNGQSGAEETKRTCFRRSVGRFKQIELSPFLLALLRKRKATATTPLDVVFSPPSRRRRRRRRRNQQRRRRNLSARQSMAVDSDRMPTMLSISGIGNGRRPDPTPDWGGGTPFLSTYFFSQKKKFHN